MQYNMMTSNQQTLPFGEDASMSSREDSHANRSQQPGSEKAQKMTARGSSPMLLKTPSAMDARATTARRGYPARGCQSARGLDEATADLERPPHEAD